MLEFIVVVPFATIGYHLLVTISCYQLLQRLWRAQYSALHELLVELISGANNRLRQLLELVAHTGWSGTLAPAAPPHRQTVAFPR